jgi:hypothetical protein
MFKSIGILSVSMKNLKYKGVLDSLKNSGRIDEETYSIIMSSDIDSIISAKDLKIVQERAKALAISGFTEDQNLRLHAAYLTLVAEVEDHQANTPYPKILDRILFDEFYKEVKRWYQDVKMDIIIKRNENRLQKGLDRFL